MQDGKLTSIELLDVQQHVLEPNVIVFRNQRFGEIVDSVILPPGSSKWLGFED